MPTPNEGEEQGHFISRCVRQVIGEGKTQQQALGQCYGIWRQHRGGTKKMFADFLKQDVNKITRNAFLFFDSDDPDNATCGSCSLRDDDGTCLPLDRHVEKNWSCGAYLAGPYSGGKPTGAYSAEDLGLVKRKPQCQRCEYGGGECGLYKMLNKELPEVFDLDTKIDECDCCNAWTDPKLAKNATVQSVHATTAIGNEDREDKIMDFAEALAQLEQVSEAKHPDASPTGIPNPADDIVRQAKNGWSGTLKITKTDPDRRLLFGWASVVEKNGEVIVDKQGDIIPAVELENAVYKFMLESRDGGDMHEARGKMRAIASIVTTADIQKAMGASIDQVGWFVGFYVDDDALWKKLKSGEQMELSIGGAAVPVEAERASFKALKGRRLTRPPF